MNRKRTPPWRERRPPDFFDYFFEDIRPYRSREIPSDIFDDFERPFRHIQQRMNNLYSDAMRGTIPPPEQGGPRIYGWTFKMGPDGKPIIQEFGNMPGQKQNPNKQIQGCREPLVDIQETAKDMTIITEIPGISKEDIDVETTEDTVIISVNNPERKYYKEVPLPTETDANTADASYNNGVLSITLQKKKPKKKGRKLNIK
jgi:HSP20 family protein